MTIDKARVEHLLRTLVGAAGEWEKKLDIIYDYTSEMSEICRAEALREAADRAVKQEMKKCRVWSLPKMTQVMRMYSSL